MLVQHITIDSFDLKLDLSKEIYTNFGKIKAKRNLFLQFHNLKTNMIMKEV